MIICDGILPGACLAGPSQNSLGMKDHLEEAETNTLLGGKEHESVFDK
jgi:hypothetical protein